MLNITLRFRVSESCLVHSCTYYALQTCRHFATLSCALRFHLPPHNKNFLRSWCDVIERFVTRVQETSERVP
jgi:hypothetical protein